MNDDHEYEPRPYRPRNRRRKKRVIGLPTRIALMALTIAVSVLVCAALVAKIARPYQLMHDERSQVASLSQQNDALSAENAALTHQDTYLRRPDGMETTLRSKGYVKPGEVSLIIENAPGSAAPEPDSGGFADRMRRAWNNIMGR